MDLQKQQLFSNKKLVLLVYPTLLELLLNIMVSTVDGMMVSSVGQAAISGVALVGNVTIVLLHLLRAWRLVVLFVIFRYQLIGLYDSLEPAAIELTAKLMCIHLLPAIVFHPASFSVTKPLQAASDVSFVMYVSIASMIVCRLALSWVFCVHLGWGAAGVWYAMVVDWIVRSIFFVSRWHSGAWKKKCGLC